MTVLGLMSGTSMDGLDCCLCNIKISSNFKFDYEILDSHTYTYNHSVKSKIYSLIGSYDKSKINFLDEYLGNLFAEISEKFLNNRKVDLIASHGQTLRHHSGKESLQIGNPIFLYKIFNVPIVYNFRVKDISLGGTGAPIVPFLDWLLFKNLNQNVITLNIGGISNITFIKKDGIREHVLGFDTGPGMCLIDEYVKHIYNESFDLNSKYSIDGTVNKKMMEQLIKKC